MVPCFTCLMWIWAWISPFTLWQLKQVVCFTVASGGPTFSWSMSWAQIPKNGLFSSWNRWEAGQVFGKGTRLTVYRGWLGYQQRSGTIYWRVQCQLEMPSLSRHLFVDEFARRQIPSSAGVISLLGCTCFLWKFLDFSVAMCVCVRSPNPPKMAWNMSWIKVKKIVL